MRSVVLAGVLYAAGVDGKGSPAGSSYGRSSGVYGGRSSSRYFLYPAAAGVGYYGTRRNYRSSSYYHNRNQQQPARTQEMKTSQEVAWKYVLLDLKFDAPETPPCSDIALPPLLVNTQSPCSDFFQSPAPVLKLAEVQFFQPPPFAEKPIANVNSFPAGELGGRIADTQQITKWLAQQKERLSSLNECSNTASDPLRNGCENVLQPAKIANQNPLSIVFAFEAPMKLAQYQLGASVQSDSTFKAKWSLYGTNDVDVAQTMMPKTPLDGDRRLPEAAAGPSWNLLDSTNGEFISVQSGTFSTNILDLASPGACPFGYSKLEGRTVRSNTAAVATFNTPDVLQCAAGCDTKGLDCIAYSARVAVATDTTHCTYFGADWTADANGNKVVEKVIPAMELGSQVALCYKEGLVDCNDKACNPAATTRQRRRLTDDSTVGQNENDDEHGEEVHAQELELELERMRVQHQRIIEKPLATSGIRTHYGERDVQMQARAQEHMHKHKHKHTQSQSSQPRTSANNVNVVLFHCNNGNVIDRQFCCDQVGDCGDGSDEAAPFPCPAKRADAKTPFDFDSVEKFLRSVSDVKTLMQEDGHGGGGGGGGRRSGSSSSSSNIGISLGMGQLGDLVLHALGIRTSSQIARVLRAQVPLARRLRMGVGMGGMKMIQGNLTSKSFTLDLGKSTSLALVGLQNSMEGAAKRFQLQISDPTVEEILSTSRSSDSNSDSNSGSKNYQINPCMQALARGKFVTIATGPLPVPVHHTNTNTNTNTNSGSDSNLSADRETEAGIGANSHTSSIANPIPTIDTSNPTTELLLHGHTARCVRFVALSGFGPGEAAMAMAAPMASMPRKWGKNAVRLGLGGGISVYEEVLVAEDGEGMGGSSSSSSSSSSGSRGVVEEDEEDEGEGKGKAEADDAEVAVDVVADTTTATFASGLEGAREQLRRHRKYMASMGSNLASNSAAEEVERRLKEISSADMNSCTLGGACPTFDYGDGEEDHVGWIVTVAILMTMALTCLFCTRIRCK